MNLIFFDDKSWSNLLPITHTRPVAAVRCGVLTLKERWETLAGATGRYLTQPYLSRVFPVRYAADNWYINGSLIASEELWQAILALPGDTILKQGANILAVHSHRQLSPEDLGYLTLTEQVFEGKIAKIDHVWDIFSENGETIRSDFALLTRNKQTAPVPEHVTVIGDRQQIFISASATVLPCSINTMNGPVFIDDDAEVWEGCHLRGPLSIGKHAVIKMGAKIYGDTTIGPDCKVGGEVGNAVFFAHSNKGHDGFIGNAVIGEWCNFGADTNCSNLKNNYDTVKIWSEAEHQMVSTGLQFCGVIMGDHSKCSINTMFNTGTVVGVSSNIFGADFPDKHVPSFSWGNGPDRVAYNFEKAVDTARRMMARRHLSLSEDEIAVLKYLETHTRQTSL